MRLYFSEADPVSVHSLTAAAHSLLTDISVAQGNSPMLIDSLLKKYARTEEALGEMRRHIRAAANFFKHAERDPAETYTFDLRQTEFLLFDACHAYKELTGEFVPYLAVYWAWFFLGPGAGLVDTTAGGIIENLRRSFPGITKGSFFREALPMVSTVRP